VHWGERGEIDHEQESGRGDCVCVCSTHGAWRKSDPRSWGQPSSPKMTAKMEPACNMGPSLPMTRLLATASALPMTWGSATGQSKQARRRV
jgi:hypothetical protein